MKVNHAVEVANILRHNIVQGVRDASDEDGRWGMCFLFRVLLAGVESINRVDGWANWDAVVSQNYGYTRRLNGVITTRSKLMGRM